MINWKKIAKRIPHFVTIRRKAVYEVVWIDEFKNDKVVGETRWDPKQIVIKTNQTPRETVHTYIHEVLHAISQEYNVALTEAQVMALEDALTVALTAGNIFKE